MVAHFRPGVDGQARFRRTPIGYSQANHLPVVRRRPTGETALLDLADLEEFRALGGTDYVLFRVSFDPAARSGVIASWLGCPLLATAPFAAAVPGPWRPVGEHVLRGLETPMPILAMAPPQVTRGRVRPYAFPQRP